MEYFSLFPPLSTTENLAHTYTTKKSTLKGAEKEPRDDTVVSFLGFLFDSYIPGLELKKPAIWTP